MNERTFVFVEGWTMSDEIFTNRGERTRGEILQAAHSLFLERGFHGASMRQIAQKAGIALGGIYNHFASKEDIFRAVFLEHHPYRQIFLKIDEFQGDTVEDALRTAAYSIAGELGGRTDFLKLMFIELVEFNGQHIQQLFPLIFPHISRFAQRFLAGREELRDVPPLVLVRSFIGLFFSYAITEAVIADQLPPEGREHALDYFLDIYLHGILKSDSPVEAA
jgi:AcrR family transcriptional regulator